MWVALIGAGATIAAAAIGIFRGGDLYRAYKEEKRRKLRSKLTGTCAHVRIEQEGDRFMIVWDGMKPSMSMTAVCTGCGLTCHVDMTSSVIEHWGRHLTSDPTGTVKEISKRKKRCEKLKRKLMEAGG